MASSLLCRLQTQIWQFGNKNTVKINVTYLLLCRLQGLNVTAVELFGSLDTTGPATVQQSPMDLAETQSIGAHSSADGAATYSRPVRQGPGGNSSLVLG